jgi:hypothetical protein
MDRSKSKLPYTGEVVGLGERAEEGLVVILGDVSHVDEVDLGRELLDNRPDVVVGTRGHGADTDGQPVVDRGHKAEQIAEVLLRRNHPGQPE